MAAKIALFEVTALDLISVSSVMTVLQGCTLVQITAHQGQLRSC